MQFALSYLLVYLSIPCAFCNKDFQRTKKIPSKTESENLAQTNNPGCALPGSAMYPECQKTTKIPSTEPPKPTTQAIESDGAINYFGVCLGIFTKYGSGGSFPPPQSYNMDDIKTQLRVLNANNRHNLVTTYSSGGEDSREPCNYGDCLVTQAAGEINRDLNSVSITVSQGIREFPQNRDMQDREIRRAFEESERANNVRSGTVWALIFTNEYVTDDNSGRYVLDMIRNNKGRAQNMRPPLKVGTRTNLCYQFATNTGAALNYLRRIVMESDYIMCNIYPNPDRPNKVDIQPALDDVQGHYNAVAREIKQINPSIEVLIGETGWASQGATFFHPAEAGTVDKLKQYWNGMQNWAFANQVRIHMFEAIDEPNKGGPEGEKHFGRWQRASDNSNRYIEK